MTEHRSDLERGASSATGAYDAVDVVRAVQTPEGVAIALSVAGLPVRAAAYLIDFAVRGVALLSLLLLLAPFGEAASGLWLVFAFLIEWFYPVFFEMTMAGATPGKRIFGLRVVHEDGTEVSLAASMLRNVLRVADFLPMGYAIGALTMLADHDFRRLGDMAAGTIVVHRRESLAILRLDEVEPVPLAVALTADERRAVLAFAERSAALSPARQIELAEVALPLLEVGGVRAEGAAAVAALRGVARWLLEGAA